MSSSIQLSGVNFSRATSSLTLPDRRDVVGEYILGASQAASVVNLAAPSSPLTVVGLSAVTYNSHSAIVSNNTGSVGAGFSTGITPYYDHTLIVIRKPTTATDVMLVVGGAATDGTLTFNGLAQVVGNDYTFSGQTMANYNQGATRATPTGFFFEAGVFQQGAKSTLYGYSAGVISSTQSPAARVASPAAYSIGNSAWGTAQSCEVAYVAIINRILTQTEVDTAGQALKAFYARLGVTVS